MQNLIMNGVLSMGLPNAKTASRHLEYQNMFKVGLEELIKRLRNF